MNERKLNYWTLPEYHERQSKPSAEDKGYGSFWRPPLIDWPLPLDHSYVGVRLVVKEVTSREARQGRGRG